MNTCSKVNQVDPNQGMVYDQFIFSNNIINTRIPTRKPTRLTSSKSKFPHPPSSTKLLLKPSLPKKSQGNNSVEGRSEDILPPIDYSKASVSNTLKSQSPIRSKQKNPTEILKTPEVNKNLDETEYYNNLFETYRLINDKTRQKIMLSQIPTPIKTNRNRTIIPNNDFFKDSSKKIEDRMPLVIEKLEDTQKIVQSKARGHAIHGSLIPCKRNISNLNLISENFQAGVPRRKKESGNLKAISQQKNIIHEFNRGLDSATRYPISLHQNSKSIGEMLGNDQPRDTDNKSLDHSKKGKRKFFCCF